MAGLNEMGSLSVHLKYPVGLSQSVFVNFNGFAGLMEVIA